MKPVTWAAQKGQKRYPLRREENWRREGTESAEQIAKQM